MSQHFIIKYVCYEFFVDILYQIKQIPFHI
jgi:hypothetical protein